MERRLGSTHQIDEAGVMLHHRMPLYWEHYVGLVQRLQDVMLDL
jgi:hypothetical protein